MNNESQLKRKKPRSLRESFGIFFTTSKNIRIDFLSLILGGLVTGLMIQVNWIHYHCTLNTNAAQVERICRYIPLRIGLGGPAFIIVFFLIFMLISVVYIRHLEITDFTHILKRLSLTYGLFILFAISPLIGWSESVYYIVFIMWIASHFYFLKKETLAVITDTFSRSSGKVSFEFSRDQMQILFEGQLTLEVVKDHLNEILTQIYDDNSRKKVLINLEKVDEMDEFGFSLISMYLSYAKINDLSVDLVTGKQSAKLAELAKKFYNEKFNSSMV